MSTSDPLAVYKSKRNFSISPEPETGGEANPAARAFVIQKHWATRLHYDFRLELDGSMKSWAIPKGPSLDPREKRMAVQVEDHPIAYNTFEGEIPPKQYGAGRVIIWDRGTWVPLGDPRQAYQQGNLKFELHGHKLHGRWALIRMKTKADKKEAWLLIKEKDGHARPAEEYSVVDALPDSVASQPPPSAQENKSSDVRSHARSSRRRNSLPARSRPRFPPNSPPSSRRWQTRRPATRMTGSTKSSLMATACWPASANRAFIYSRAMGMTGATSCSRWSRP